SPPQTPHGNDDDIVAPVPVTVPVPSEAISAVLPVQNEPVAVEIAQPRATPIPLVRTRSPLNDEGLPPESAYQGHHVRKARGRRVFVVVATLAVIVALPFVLFTGNDKPVSQVEALLPESQNQNQSAALQSESLMAENGVEGEISDIDTVALDEMVAMEQGGVEGATAEPGAIVEISSAVTAPVPPPAPPSPPAPVAKVPVAQVPVAQVQVTKPAVVAKVATPPAATLPPAAAEAKSLPALPAKTVPALVPVPVPKPVVQAAPVPVIVEPLPSPPVRVPEVPAESVKSQRDAAGVDVAALKPTFSDVDLTQLMYKFVLAYEGGDLGRLINLFASNATADGSMGHAKITRDYRELFQATDMRRMSLGTIIWRPDGAVMHGTGDFEVTVWRRGDEDPTTMKGKLSIYVGKTDKQLEVRKLTHAVSR
ncbi:MAG: hypothetical protein U1B30_02160, partial [Pseudomonadota bacterium]|nr:hypothetical protein [Pseudomonadota bacterium]